MAIDFYYSPGSAPCRIVQLVAAALNVELNLNLVDMRVGDHFTPDYLKLNPQHTVPTIVDKGFSLSESRAISRYLANNYDGESLYPKDPKARALVDQRLDFDLGTLYQSFTNYFYPHLFSRGPADDLLTKVEEALKIFDTLLEGQKYAAGSHLTLADLALVATVSTIEAAGISIQPYPNVERWFKLIKSTAPKYEEANGKGLKMVKQFIERVKRRTEF